MIIADLSAIAVLDAIPISVAVVDSSGIIQMVNKSTERLLGYSPDELSGQPIDRIIQYDASAVGEPRLTKATGISREGDAIPLDVFQSSFKVDSDLMHIIVLRDVSEKQEIEFKLANEHEARVSADAANRAKGNFLAHMSHEIRTPLNAILGFTQIIAQSGQLDETQQQNIGSIKKNGVHLLELINNVLEMSKIEAGQIAPDETNFRLHGMCMMIESMFEQEARQRGIEFYVSIAPDLPEYIIADEARLRQIIVNLVGNALKFTDSGRVVLRLTKIDTTWTNHLDVVQMPGMIQLVMEVADTGKGIPAEQIDSIFEPFEQADQSVTGAGGSGLGLAISRNFVDQLNGKIELTSEVGKGTTVSVYVPCRPGSRHEHAREIQSIGNLKVDFDGTQPPRILVVDDSDGNRFMLRQMLTQVGFEVYEAYSAETGVALFKASLPDVVLMDLKMPDVDGYQATNLLKAINPNVPVIIVSAIVFQGSILRAREIGADGFVKKPFTFEEILGEIHRVCDVRFSYSNGKKSSAPISIKTPISNISLGPDEIKELRDAAMSGDQQKVIDLVNHLDMDRSLKEKLQELVAGFEYEKVLDVLK